MIGTSVMGTSLLRLGEFAQARAHHNKALALYVAKCFEPRLPWELEIANSLVTK